MAHNRSVLASTSLSAAAFLFASPAFQPPSGNVIVVDDDGPPPYTTIQAAVDAAQDGDVLLVRTGIYPTFRITNKSLVVVSDVGAHVYVAGAMRVIDLPMSKTVVLANLVATGGTSSFEETASGLYLANNTGHVRVEACEIAGGFSWTYSSTGATVRACADVAFIGCNLRGGSSSSFANDANGLAASDSSVVTVYGSVLRGGDGLDAGCVTYGNSGGDGGDVRQSFLFGSSSSFFGGHGGDVQYGSFYSCPLAGSGGAGVFAVNASVILLDSQTIGGAGGGGIYPGCGGCLSYGYTGDDRSGATFADILGNARTLVAPTPAHAGTTQNISVRGEPGDQVGLIVGAQTSTAVYVPAWRGMLLVPVHSAPNAQALLTLGTVPASGVITFPLAIPALPPGAPSQTVFLQALFRDVSSQRYLSGARSMTVLP